MRNIVRKAHRIETDFRTDQDSYNWNKIKDCREYLAKDSIDKKSLFTRLSNALKSEDFATASKLQVEMYDKVEELGDYIYARLCKDDLGGLDVDMVETAEAKAEFAEAGRSYGVSATPSDAWTDGKSLFIQYQQYEIVPYAYGAPLVTLPMEVARPYLSAELLELLNK